jgi:FtsZ-interacting cell division protein YlmF
MIGIFKKLSDKLSNNMLAPGAEEADAYYDEYDEEYDDYEEQNAYYDEEPEPIQVHSTKAARKNAAKTSSSNLRNYRSYGAKDNVYGFNTGVAVNKPSETLIIHPKNMEDAVAIGSHVRSGRMCIVDLTGVPTPEAQRIADYLCGNSDALDGSITRVNGTILAVSPPNHRVMPDYREDPFDAGFLKASSDR